MGSFALLFAVGLVCGSINSIALKICYQTQTTGADGSLGYFQKPWFMSLLMFVAMLIALPLHFCMQIRKRANAARELPDGANASNNYSIHVVNAETGSNAKLRDSPDRNDSMAPDSGNNLAVQEGSDTESSEEEGKITPKLVWIVLFPSICDLLGTSMQQMGLCITTVSVFQMLKGSILLFSAILSVKFLDRKMEIYNWIGVGLCTLSLGIVGMASVWATNLAAEDKAFKGIMDHKVEESLHYTGAVNISSHEADAVADAAADSETVASSLYMQLFGITIIIAGQVVCASQYIVEEFLLKPPNVAAPMALVGLEGFWGCLVMAILLPIFQMLPGSDVGGSYENTDDSWYRVSHSSTLMGFSWIFFISVLIYNIVGVTVTAESSAVHHTFLDASRTVVIWVLSVGLNQIYPEYGEELNAYSPMQAVGFVFLIMGQLVYDGVVRLPGVSYDSLDNAPTSILSRAASPLLSYNSRFDDGKQASPASLRPSSFPGSPGERFVTEGKGSGSNILTSPRTSR